jgi:sulfonate transport system substrate-binding protein
MAKNQAIKTVADLKGKTVAGPKGTLLHHLLFVALKKEGLKPADMTFVNMGIPQAQAALISGSIDAALIAGLLWCQQKLPGRGSWLVVTALSAG